MGSKDLRGKAFVSRRRSTLRPFLVPEPSPAISFQAQGQEDAMLLAITYGGETFEEVTEYRSAAPQTLQPAANALQIGGDHVGAL
jgi:hypothetical protein